MTARAYLSVPLREAHAMCFTTQNGEPVLDVSTDSVVLALAAPDHRVLTVSDMVATEALLAAVRKYALAVGRLYAEQNDIPVAHVNGPNDPAAAEAVA